MRLNTSYQTVPINEYSAELKERAARLFSLVQQRLGPRRVREHKGSFSVFAHGSQATAAKIVLYEQGKGKINGFDPELEDGIYILVRVPGGSNVRTIGVAPKHDERFAFFRLADDQNLDEMADFVGACATLECSLRFRRAQLFF
jgi:hypothetical protein